MLSHIQVQGLSPVLLIPRLADDGVCGDDGNGIEPKNGLV